MTDGRYRRVRVDDRDLDIEVMAPEKGDWVKVSALSQGTLDLVYLTARLGLVRLVTGDRRPPLLMDDPFVTLDDTRAMRALQLLKSVATDFQVIYMTTSDRYDSAADSVVELPGPTAIDDGETGCRAGSRGAVLIDVLSGATGAVVFGLGSALAWGAGDFGGGLTSRRAPVFGVVFISQIVGMALAFGLALLLGETWFRHGPRLEHRAAGSPAASASRACIAALSIGRMAVVAPVTAVLAAMIPVGVGFVTEGLPNQVVIGRDRPGGRRRRPRVARRGRGGWPIGRAGSGAARRHRVRAVRRLHRPARATATCSVRWRSSGRPRP